MEKQGGPKFARLLLEFKEDVLNKKITPEEFLLLVWIHLGANGMSGTSHISFAGLSADLQDTFDKNKTTKLVRSLFRKKYLWYPKRQGCSGAFKVWLHKYGLLSRGYTDIQSRFEKDFVVTPKETDATSSFTATASAEVVATGQKTETPVNGLKWVPHPGFNTPESRTPNTDKDTDTEIDKKPISVPNKYKTSEFVPDSYEREECLRIARKYREGNMMFLLSKLAKLGFPAIRTAEIATDERIQNESKRPLGNPMAYFNRVLTHIEEGKKWDGSPLDD